MERGITGQERERSRGYVCLYGDVPAVDSPFFGSPYSALNPIVGDERRPTRAKDDSAQARRDWQAHANTQPQRHPQHLSPPLAQTGRARAGGNGGRAW